MIGRKYRININNYNYIIVYKIKYKIKYKFWRLFKKIFNGK